jgi:hypothetical protein
MRSSPIEGQAQCFARSRPDDGGQEVAAGVYFYRLDAGEFSATRRLVKLR